MKNDKIIFVDVDGPLSYGTWPDGKVKINNRLKIHYAWVQRDCDALTEVINKTGANVVISSDWKLHYTIEEMGQIFEHYGIPNVIVGATDDYKVKMSSQLEWDRADQIMKWVVENELEMRNWIALDDLRIAQFFGDKERCKDAKRINRLNHIECDGDHSEFFKGIPLSQKVGEILDWFDYSIDLEEIKTRRNNNAEK